MRLIGCSKVDQLNPTLVDTRGLSMHSTSVPTDTLGKALFGAISSCTRLLFESRDMLGEQITHLTPQTVLVTQTLYLQMGMLTPKCARHEHL